MSRNAQNVIKIDASLNQEIFIAKYQSVNNQPDFSQIIKYMKKDIPDGHTFFPEDWNYPKTIEQIASARANPNTTSWSTHSPWSNGIEAASESGVVIRWFDIVDQPANTYFPKF